MSKEINWIERNSRSYLKDVLPLDTPLKIEIEPTSACNFKCNYCKHSSEKIKPEFMSIDIFNKIIEGIDKFPNKIKTFNFCGIGEPLLNKDIYYMINKIKDLVEGTVLITNGSALTRENSDKLIKSGIKTIRISLQGVNEEDYYNISNYKIDFNKFLDNIKYLYENKSSETKLFLKMPDIAINTEERKELFYKLFEDKCDYLVIQNIGKLFKELNYDNIIINDVNDDILVCPQPFYAMFINVNGKVYPCCHMYGDMYIGDITKNSLIDIWNGTVLKKIRIKHLEGKKDLFDMCRNCEILNYFHNKYDNIDTYRNKLLHLYKYME